MAPEDKNGAVVLFKKGHGIESKNSREWLALPAWLG
jgi:hypothetical protein